MDSDAEVKEGQYRCSICGGVFDLVDDGEWNDGKAKQELERDFGGISLEDCSMVCDDCYRKVCPTNNPELFELYKKECGERN